MQTRKVLKRGYQKALSFLTVVMLAAILILGVFGAVKLGNAYAPTIFTLTALSMVNVHILDKFGR